MDNITECLRFSSRKLLTLAIMSIGFCILVLALSASCEADENRLDFKRAEWHVGDEWVVIMCSKLWVYDHQLGESIPALESTYRLKGIAITDEILINPPNENWHMLDGHIQWWRYRLRVESRQEVSGHDCFVLKVTSDGCHLPTEVIEKHGLRRGKYSRYKKLYVRVSDYLLVQYETYDANNNKMLYRQSCRHLICPRIVGVGLLEAQAGMPDLNIRKSDGQLCIPQDDGTLVVLMSESSAPEVLAAIADKGLLEGSATKRNGWEWERQIWKPGLPWYSQSHIYRNSNNGVYLMNIIRLLSWNDRVFLDEEGNPLPEEKPDASPEDAESTQEDTGLGDSTQEERPDKSSLRMPCFAWVIIAVGLAALGVGTYLVLARRKR